MESQRRNVESQLIANQATVDQLTATRNGLDVNFVALQLEAGTGAQLLEQITGQLGSLKSSHLKVVAAGKDALCMLEALSKRESELEVSRGSVSRQDSKSPPFTHTHTAARGSLLSLPIAVNVSYCSLKHRSHC